MQTVEDKKKIQNLKNRYRKVNSDNKKREGKRGWQHVREKWLGMTVAGYDDEIKK